MEWIAQQFKNNPPTFVTDELGRIHAEILHENAENEDFFADTDDLAKYINDSQKEKNIKEKVRKLIRDYLQTIQPQTGTSLTFPFTFVDIDVFPSHILVISNRRYSTISVLGTTLILLYLVILTIDASIFCSLISAALQPLRVEDEYIIQKLFPPIEFPLKLDISALKSMLTKPLLGQIPVSYNPRIGLNPALVPGTDMSTVLFLEIVGWLENRDPPSQDSAEIEWSGWWDNLIRKTLSNGTAHNHVEGVRIRRNKEDPSGSTSGGKKGDKGKRDFYFWLKNILLLAGEDKSAKKLIVNAYNELRDKCAGDKFVLLTLKDSSDSITEDWSIY
jgi:hypothetical protein